MTINVETSAPTSSVGTQAAGRWLQLALGVLCMTMIANLQYGWTLLSPEELNTKIGDTFEEKVLLLVSIL